MSVFENVLVCAAYARGTSERASYRRCVETLELTRLTDKANHQAGKLTLLNRKRLELARALAGDPSVLLLDEIAGGLTEAEVEELIGTIRDLHAEGISIIWIEHIVHALLEAVDRIFAINFGRQIAEGEPQAGHVQRRGAGLLHGGHAGMSILELQDVDVFYGDFQALFSISFSVEEGQTFAVIGANGAGKSTMLKTIAGVLRPRSGQGALRGGVDRPRERPRAGRHGHLHGARGAARLPEPHGRGEPADRRLRGAQGRLGRGLGLRALPAARSRWPNVSRRASRAGEQQALAIGRALMSNPRLVLLDEVSLGLAPVVIKRIYEAMEALPARGTTILVVEQDVQHVLTVADRVACFLEGRISLEGAPGELSSDDITAAYFGM